MKPHVICHMNASVDGRILDSRWRRILRTAPQPTLPVGSGTVWAENPMSRYRREGSRSSIALGCNCGLLAQAVRSCLGCLALYWSEKVHQLIDWGASKLPCIGKANAGASTPEG